MFCNQCGTKIPDNSKFCGVCGAKQDLAPAVEIPGKPKTEILVEKPPVLFGDGNDVSAPEWKDPVDVAEPKEEKGNFLKNLDLKKILIAAGALVVVVAMILGGIAMFSGKDSENVFICYSNGRYKLVSNVKKAETVDIASAKSDNVNWYSVQFSPDGKYVYFVTKMDYSNTGSLCRAEYAKLKDGSKRNDKYIETIASNVQYATMAFTESGEVLYLNGDNTMYHYDGKEVTQLAKHVSFFDVDEKDRLVYGVDDDEGRSSLYAMKLKNPEDKTKLVADYYDIRMLGDLDNILYTEINDDGTEDLYKVDFAGTEEKLGEDAKILYISDDKTYVTIGTGENLSLYQFVNDPNAAAEAGMTEPVDEDFMIPYYDYNMVRGSNLKESDFSELYTSCTRALYWYGESSWYSYSMNDAVEKSWGDETVQIHEATRNFVNKYADSADKNGYIKVTPAVKADLQAINAAGGGEDWQWLWLCYDKEDTGSLTFDNEAWSEAYNQWMQVEGRVYLREQLKNEENDVAVKNLCVFEDGKLTVVANNVVSQRQMGGALLYNTVDMLLGDAVNIEEVDSVRDVSRLLELSMEDQNHFVYMEDTSKGQLTENVLMAYEEASEDGGASLRFSKEKVYLHNEEGYLGVATIKSGEIGEFEMIADDAGEYIGRDDVAYYTSGVYYNDGVAYCDVYEYKNGKSTMLARDVMYDTILIYEDGQMQVYTDYRYSSGYELGIVNKKGELSLVADDVRSVVRADKNLMLFISDGDLYSYDGKNKKMVCSDVDMFWAKEQMHADASIYGG